MEISAMHLSDKVGLAWRADTVLATMDDSARRAGHRRGLARSLGR